MTQLNDELNVTESAIQKIAELLSDEQNSDSQDSSVKLRIYIEGGGCSGFKYGFVFDDTIEADDTVIYKELSSPDAQVKIGIVIDCLSFQYLLNAEIDYKNDVNGEQFIIRNPNAKTTCGCGSSFSVD